MLVHFLTIFQLGHSKAKHDGAVDSQCSINNINSRLFLEYNIIGFIDLELLIKKLCF